VDVPSGYGATLESGAGGVKPPPDGVNKDGMNKEKARRG
jgi:hypothetical protein